MAVRARVTSPPRGSFILAPVILSHTAIPIRIVCLAPGLINMDTCSLLLVLDPGEPTSSGRRRDSPARPEAQPGPGRGGRAAAKVTAAHPRSPGGQSLRRRPPGETGCVRRGPHGSSPRPPREEAPGPCSSAVRRRGCQDVSRGRRCPLPRGSPGAPPPPPAPPLTHRGPTPPGPPLPSAPRRTACPSPVIELVLGARQRVHHEVDRGHVPRRRRCPPRRREAGGRGPGTQWGRGGRRGRGRSASDPPPGLLVATGGVLSSPAAAQSARKKEPAATAPGGVSARTALTHAPPS